MPNFQRPDVFMDALQGVVGQDDMKVKLASAFSQYTLFLDDPDAGRPVVLVFGPSGSGKTFAIERLCRTAGLPYTAVSSAAISPPSYKGQTLQDCLVQHWMDHQTDQGIFFLDEVDKWTRGAVGSDAESVSMGVRSQAEILKFVERDEINLTDYARDFEHLSGVVLETRNLMWVMAGAFVGLDRVIKSRLQNVHYPPEDVWTHAVPADFVRYGMIPELVNRVGTWSWVRPLTRMQIMEIIRDQEKPSWIRRFQAIECELELHDSALANCAQSAYQQGTGARGAASLLRRSLDDVFVHASKHRLSHVLVDAPVVQTGKLEILSA